MSALKGVEDTLFIPLAGRVLSSKNYKEFFYDEKALELEQYIPRKAIAENTGEYFTIAAIARFYEFDKLVKEFIEKNGESNILCLGAGLETMYFRINDKRATFYEVDFPNVIDQRKIVLGENDHEILIGSDLLEFSWMDKVDKTKPCLAIVSGVFQYLKHEEVVSLIKALQDNFNNIEIAFDATNKTGIKSVQKYIKKTGNGEAMVYFYLNKIEPFAEETNTKLLSVIPFYKNCTRILKDKLKFSTKFNCYFGDKLGFTKIVHLKIK